MSETSSKARAKEKKQTRAKDTSRGIYTKVRSKFVKGKDGYGAVVTLAREKALEANGGKLPKDSAVHHKKGSVAGAKNTEDDNHWGVLTKGDNTRESNMRRGKRSKEYIRKKLGKNV
jgi:hypothetical protein